MKEILDHLAEVPQAERRSCLERLCAGDPELQREVEGFLELEDQVGDFIEEPLWRAIPDGDGEETTGGNRIGPYRLERLLGQGGMGEVYLAVREDDYEQKVAIKRMLGPSLDHRSLQRFVNERQILASLQHPGIARLLDGGADEDGRPYLVMEYVEGSQIDRYCDDNELSLRQRLHLMSKVCRIVHHAHKNLVIHRDLKPSNILVSQEGQPRLLDFGIAKLMHSDTALTAQGTAALTPACASPEQIMGERVTTACDVYALGVLLYRLLAGTAPYALDGQNFAVVRRIVCLQDVDKPSVAALRAVEKEERNPDSFVIDTATLEQTAEASATKLSKKRRRSRQLSGDLDAIVLKAMRKEPEHRYGSAAELAEEIDRYLAGMPVEARRGNWFYHAGKHLSRNKPIVASMALVLVLAVAATGLAITAATAGRAAVEARAASEAMQVFVTAILESALPDQDKGRERTVSQVIEGSLPEMLVEYPDIQRDMFTTLGGFYIELGEAERGLELHRRALHFGTTVAPPSCTEKAGLVANVGWAYYELNDFATAVKHYTNAMKALEACDDGEPLQLALTLFNLTNARMHNGMRAGIGEAYQQVLDLRLQHGASKELLASSHYSLGTWSLRSRQTPKAIEHLEEALRLRREVDGDVATGVARIAKTLARAYHDAGQLERAKPLYEESLALHARLLGAEDKVMVRLQPHFIRLLLDLEQHDEAIAMARQTRELSRAILPQNHPAHVIAESVWGACLARQGRREEAEPLLQAGLQVLGARADGQGFAARWTRRELEKLR